MKKKIFYNFIKQLEIIFEDEKRFSSYFEKNYPSIKKVLPNLKLIVIISLFFSINYDYQNYIENTQLLYSGLKTEEAIHSDIKLSLILIYIYFFLILFDFFISMFVIFKANHPIENKMFQMAKQTAKLVMGASATGYVVAIAPVEPNAISNFVHTKTPVGRGYDFETGDLASKIKGHLIASKLQRDMMLEAVKEHGPDSKLLTDSHLGKIMADEKYGALIRERATSPEKITLGFPLVEPGRFLKKTILGEGELTTPPSNNPNNVDQDNDNEPVEQATNPSVRPMKARRANSAPIQRTQQPQEERPIRRVNSDPTPRRSNR